MARQGTVAPATSKKGPSCSAGGIRACWISAAIRSSCSRRAFSVASRYSRAFSMATAAWPASVSSAPRVAGDLSTPLSRLSRYSTPIRFSPLSASASSTYRTSTSGTHSTCRMPRTIVAVWACACIASARSMMRASPVAKTSSGILRDVSKVRPGSVTRPRPRPTLKSRTLSAPASMMNPRSAPVTSRAESITIVSTSSSTRPEPRARRLSSSVAIWRKSPEVATERVSVEAPPTMKTISHSEL